MLENQLYKFWTQFLLFLPWNSPDLHDPTRFTNGCPPKKRIVRVIRKVIRETSRRIPKVLTLCPQTLLAQENPKALLAIKLPRTIKEKLSNDENCPIHGGTHKWGQCHQNQYGDNFKPCRQTSTSTFMSHQGNSMQQHRCHPSQVQA